MTNDNLAKIKTRIQALLAKAASTTHEAEAEAFLAKANELLEQYQLDIGDLVAGNDPVMEYTGIRMARSGHAWRWKLYVAVGALYGCKAYMHNGPLLGDDGKPVFGANGFIDALTVKLVGRESAAVTTDLMFPWIVEQVRSTAKDISKVTGMSEQGQAKRVAAALITRIWGLVRSSEKERSNSSTAAGRNALVTLDAVNARFAELTAGMVTKKARASVSDSMSREAAGGIGLHRQTGGASQLRLS